VFFYPVSVELDVETSIESTDFGGGYSLSLFHGHFYPKYRNFILNKCTVRLYTAGIQCRNVIPTEMSGH